MTETVCYGEFNCPLGKYRESRRCQGKTYTVLRRACTSRQIRSAKIDGKFWMIQSEVDSFLDSLKPRADQQAAECQASSPIDAMHSLVDDIDTRLLNIADAVERIATAIESIATQPKTAQQELLSTVSSNGFHH
jgi:predicted  nucleic acid-binding Zn-ribbon protein